MEKRERRWQRGCGGREGGEKAPGASGRQAERYSRVVEDAPAAVGVARAQALAAAPVLTARLHGDSGELGADNKGEGGQHFAEHTVIHQKEMLCYRAYHLKQCRNTKGTLVTIFEQVDT